MGVTIESKNCSIDLGYGGFKALRTKVAELTAPDIYEHYKILETGMMLFGTVRQSFFLTITMQKYSNYQKNIMAKKIKF